MLVITRKVGQRILIGDDITVMVVRIDESSVRLGIEAPRGILIDREEVRGRLPHPPPPYNLGPVPEGAP